MKKIMAFLMALLMLASFAACGKEKPLENKEPEKPIVSEPENIPEQPTEEDEKGEVSAKDFENATEIILSEKITVDGKPAEESDCVTVGGEIVYYRDVEKYPSGNEYGDGEKEDMHTESEAAEHTLVTITKPGDYFVKGKLKGQLAIDLGEGAKEDPAAKVTIIFGGAKINCEIAPAVIFYNVYECEKNEKPSKDADTASAGANIVVADGSINNINGANVAEIYKDGGEEERLHKYDAALYSKMSMNILGGEKGTGVLNVTGKNEGIGTEMHLSFCGGIVNVEAEDDGINANKDGVSVITLNSGKLTAKGGFGREGDGIDSNGWLVINGGELYSSGNGRSADGGIDADNGIFIDGGKVVAFGGRNDSISKDSKQLFAVLKFDSEVAANEKMEFIDSEGKGIETENDRFFKEAVISSPDFIEGREYALSVGGNIQEFYANLENESQFGEKNGDIPERNEDFVKEQGNPYKAPAEIRKWLESEKDMPKEIREWIEKMIVVSKNFEIPEEKPFDDEPQKIPFAEDEGRAEDFLNLKEKGEDKTVFVLSKEKPLFKGILNSVTATGKEAVTFTINKSGRIEDLSLGELPEIESIECSEKIPSGQIRLCLEYVGRDENINISRSCLLSDGYEKVNSLFEDLLKGNYRFSIEVTEENKEFGGIEFFHFDVVG